MGVRSAIPPRSRRGRSFRATGARPRAEDREERVVLRQRDRQLERSPFKNGSQLQQPPPCGSYGSVSGYDES